MFAQDHVLRHSPQKVCPLLVLVEFLSIYQHYSRYVCWQIHWKRMGITLVWRFSFCEIAIVYLNILTFAVHKRKWGCSLPLLKGIKPGNWARFGLRKVYRKLKVEFTAQNHYAAGAVTGQVSCGVLGSQDEMFLGSPWLQEMFENFHSKFNSIGKQLVIVALCSPLQAWSCPVFHLAITSLLCDAAPITVLVFVWFSFR